jgi:glycosyltransferase, group 2 family
LHPYHHLHTANLMMKRTTALTYPFDERFKRYGFEDVLLGKRLQEYNVCIAQINNPLLFDHFETNDSYMEKTEEALQTLYTFRNELSGFSSLLTLNYHLRRWGLHYLILFIFQQKRRKWRTILCGERPNLKLYIIYKLGYFISLF